MSLHYHPCNAKACEPSGTSVADLVAAERERILEMLVSMQDIYAGMTDIYDEGCYDGLNSAVAAIERGAHLEEK